MGVRWTREFVMAKNEAKEAAWRREVAIDKNNKKSRLNGNGHLTDEEGILRKWVSQVLGSIHDNNEVKTKIKNYLI